ncbi:MAG: asparagine synthase (glutamine-hydrolyzing) [Nitrosarchaeum sp.]|nr:asparagine synthase (glutamine-hydrolyzing) [Nitrosarchaeum sp.]
MCGIIGALNVGDESLLHKMCENIAHRGPDEEGIFKEENIGLGIRRLSIIDIDGGKQPISNETHDIWTVFNGEIYNYREIQSELIKKGHKFQTNSDTETIVHAYEEYGLDFVKVLRGMFAIAIWDYRKNKIVLVRDRIGIKPLYYWIKENKLLFSSELKALLECDEIKLFINKNAVNDYLSFLYVPAPQTIFQDIYKLLPGEILIFEQNGKHTLQKYWDIEFSNYHDTEEKYTKRLRELLEESTQLRMVSDVPVGVLLSSGLDSSIVATLAAKKSPYEINTYTVGFEDSDDKSYDELKESREFAEQLGTNHNEIIVDSQDALKQLDNVVWQLDEPFSNPTTTLNYIISEFASKTSKVVLSGVGGDEMFGGYPKYKALKIFDDFSKVPNFIIKDLNMLIQKLPDSSGENIVKAKRFFDSWKKNQIDQYISFVTYFSDKEKEKIIGKVNRPYENKIKEMFKKAEEQGAQDFFKKMFYVECKSYLPNNILEYTDKTSMAVSLETREPLLDHKIVEFSANIPFNLKIKNGTTKYVLKQAVKDIIPKEVLSRKKRGFTPPLINWLNKNIRELESKYIIKDEIKRRKIIEYDEIEKIFSKFKEGKKQNYMKIWNIICLEAWFKEMEKREIVIN